MKPRRIPEQLIDPSTDTSRFAMIAHQQRLHTPLRRAFDYLQGVAAVPLRP
jgi:hypothetical protein